MTRVVKNGLDVGTFTNIVYRNLDIASAKYEGLLFQGRYNIRPRWTLNGHYTLQFKNDGNYEGEAANQPGVPSSMGDYPRSSLQAAIFPDGRLAVFQRHKLALWTIYNLGLGRLGDVTLSGLWRVNSGQPTASAPQVSHLRISKPRLTSATRMRRLTRRSISPSGDRRSSRVTGHRRRPGLQRAGFQDVPAVHQVRHRTTR